MDYKEVQFKALEKINDIEFINNHNIGISIYDYNNKKTYSLCISDKSEDPKHFYIEFSLSKDDKEPSGFYSCIKRYTIDYPTNESETIEVLYLLKQIQNKYEQVYYSNMLNM